MKLKFITMTASPERQWEVEYTTAIRIVTRKTHDYLLSLFPMSIEGELHIPVENKEVYIDRTGQLSITGWPR